MTFTCSAEEIGLKYILESGIKCHLWKTTSLEIFRGSGVSQMSQILQFITNFTALGQTFGKCIPSKIGLRILRYNFHLSGVAWWGWVRVLPAHCQRGAAAMDKARGVPPAP